MSISIAGVASTLGRAAIFSRSRAIAARWSAAPDSWHFSSTRRNGVGHEVLDVVAKDLVVADHGGHVVWRVQRGGEQADFGHCAGDTRHGDEVTHLEGPQRDHESACGKVGQQARPGRADGDTDTRYQCGERGGLYAEVAQDANYQEDVQGDRHHRAEVAQHGRVHLLALQGFADHAQHQADQPAANDSENEGAQYLEAHAGHRDNDDVLVTGDLCCVHFSLLELKNRPTGSLKILVGMGSGPDTFRQVPRPNRVHRRLALGLLLQQPLPGVETIYRRAVCYRNNSSLRTLHER